MRLLSAYVLEFKRSVRRAWCSILSLAARYFCCSQITEERTEVGRRTEVVLNEGESAAETAARETEEETRGYFLREDLLTLIEGQQPVIDSDGFALYFAEIPFVPAQRVTNNPLPSDDESYTERGPYAWMPYSELDRYLKGPVEYKKKYPIAAALLPAGQNTAWFWPIWLGNVWLAIETDSIPWMIER